MFAGQTVLIVETEFIISLSMQMVLQGLGATDVVLLTSPDEFRRSGHSWDGIALAILEIENGRTDQLNLIRQARNAGTIVLGLTADGQLKKGMPDLPDMPILVKPVPDEILAEAVTALMHSHADQNE